VTQKVGVAETRWVTDGDYSGGMAVSAAGDSGDEVKLFGAS
jgi:hypothetical protein